MLKENVWSGDVNEDKFFKRGSVIMYEEGWSLLVTSSKLRMQWRGQGFDDDEIINDSGTVCLKKIADKRMP